MALDNFSLELASRRTAWPHRAQRRRQNHGVSISSPAFISLQTEKLSFNGASISRPAPQASPAWVLPAPFKISAYFRNFPSWIMSSFLFTAAPRSTFWQAVLRSPRFRREEKPFRQQAWELLEKLDLHEFGREKAGRLPYGQQRRLEIARALAAVATTSCFWMSPLPVLTPRNPKP